jgi:hypothetical protein
MMPTSSTWFNDTAFCAFFLVTNRELRKAPDGAARPMGKWRELLRISLPCCDPLLHDPIALAGHFFQLFAIDDFHISASVRN